MHTQLAKHVTFREWRQALFNSFTLRKIAIPYCRTVLLKTAFVSLRKVTKQSRKARVFSLRTLMSKAMKALMLYQMDEVKVR